MTHVEPAPATDHTAGRPPGVPAPRSAALRRLEPQEALGLRAWRCLLDDGTPVAGRWLAPAVAGSESRPSVERLREIRCAALVPVLGLARSERGTWLVSELADGVSLGRLRRRAGLSAGQVAAVMEAVLAALAELHARGLVHGRVHDENVLIGCDGRVRLADWAPGALAAPSGLGPEGDVAAAAALAAALQREAHPAPPGEADPAATRAELGALARAVHGHASAPVDHIPAVSGGLSTPPGAGGVENPPQVGRGPVVPPRAGQRPPRRTAAVLWRAGLALVVGLAVLAVEMHLFGDRVAADLQTLRPTQTASAPSPTAAAALPRLGPASAGAVAAVQAGAVRACAPARACLLRITVQVVPARQPRTVRWDVVAGRQCGGPIAPVAAGEAAVAAGADHVTTTQEVTLPEPGPLAVGVVTRSPDQAASAALPAPPGAGTC